MDYTLKRLKEQYIRLNEAEKLKGGLADGKTLEDIANHHKVSIDKLKKQIWVLMLKKNIQVITWKPMR